MGYERVILQTTFQDLSASGGVISPPTHVICATCFFKFYNFIIQGQQLQREISITNENA